MYAIGDTIRIHNRLFTVVRIEGDVAILVDDEWNYMRRSF